MLPPLGHIEDCQGMHYRLQLNAYRYILQTYYDFIVSGMYVVCTHPDNAPHAFVDDVLVLQEDIEALMQIQRCRARECVQMQSMDTLGYNPLGGNENEAASS